MGQRYPQKQNGTGAVESVNAKTGVVVLNAADVGAASVADLVNKADLVGGKIPAAQLPAGIDEITEVATFSALPVTGEPSMIYLVLDTNKEYRWSGTQYAVISDSIALGETASTAYRGDRGKTAYDHSQTTGNAHGMVKADIGLGNVNNTSDSSKPVSTATQTALDLKQDKLTRYLTEVIWQGLNLNIPTSNTNLISLLKTRTPTFGALINSHFFDTVNDKMIVKNENKTLDFKLTISGSWSGGSTSRSMTVNFTGQVPDTLTESRDQQVTVDELTFSNPFFVVKDGFLANNGSTITIRSNGGSFTANTIKLIAEQVV